GLPAFKPCSLASNPAPQSGNPPVARGRSPRQSSGGTARETTAGCPWTANSLCVGAVDSAKNMTEPQSTSNYTSDRERPDVVALGGAYDLLGAPQEGVCVADESQPEAWKRATGTSVAAPAITSMALLWRQQCEPQYQGYAGEKTLRALFRTSAFINIEGDPYSTPDPSSDAQDGAGFVDARNLVAFCEPGLDGSFGELTIDTENDGTLGLPDGELYPSAYSAVPGTHVATSLADYQSGPGDATRRWREIGSGWDGISSGRIRATISFDGCPDEASGPVPSPVSADFDLHLVREEANGHFSYVANSQSVQDTNEGFEYEVTVPGNYKVIVSWPQGAPDCFGGTLPDVGYAQVHLQ
ncbi:MAG: S8 family serine peptidase, partial [Myxococcales bacterium]|nr:S8 family serine peptidase [Myxococcales bacterium]